MARVNMAAVKIAVAKDTSGRMKVAAKERADQVFEDAVIGMQLDFDSHAVTREIAGGVDSANLSDTLSGPSYPPKNLYSFIGFDAAGDTAPLDPIWDALRPTDPAGPKITFEGKEVKAGNARFKFLVRGPDKRAIYARTPMPWASGWSWAQKVETRIPGFSRFLARKMGEPSRSGGGIQIKYDLRGDEYQPPEGGYLTGIFDRFIEQVRGYNKGGLKRRFK